MFLLTLTFSYFITYICIPLAISVYSPDNPPIPLAISVYSPEFNISGNKMVKGFS